MNSTMLLANAPAQAKSQLHSLKLTARSIGVYVNTDKTVFMSFNHGDVLSSLNDRPVKLANQFIYLGNNISFTDSDFNICLGKHGPLLTGY